MHLNRNELVTEDDVHEKDYHVADDLDIRLSDTDWLEDRADRCICYLWPNREGYLIPAQALAARRKDHRSRLPTFARHRIETPTLRSAHSDLDLPGYDRGSGLYL